MRNNIRLKIRDLVRRGGSRNTGAMKLPAPQVTATSAADKLQGNIANQAEQDQELVDMNKKLAGGGVVVPQMNQAGSSGNNSIKQQIGSALQGNADGQYDNDVLTPDQAEAASKSTVGGRRRRKTKRRKRKKKRKTKRKRKSRRKSKRKRRRSKKRRK
tara:strand:+ start:42 stop:515 length:474 start_codon:yes stop_codon:yes gene_type:complete